MLMTPMTPKVMASPIAGQHQHRAQAEPEEQCFQRAIEAAPVLDLGERGARSVAHVVIRLRVATVVRFGNDGGDPVVTPRGSGCLRAVRRQRAERRRLRCPDLRLRGPCEWPSGPNRFGSELCRARRIEMLSASSERSSSFTAASRMFASGSARSKLASAPFNALRSWLLVVILVKSDASAVPAGDQRQRVAAIGESSPAPLR